MLYQCKVPTLCELRSNHIAQIVFLSFPVVPTGNFCTTGDTSSPARDIGIAIKCRDWHYLVLESLITIFQYFLYPLSRAS